MPTAAASARGRSNRRRSRGAASSFPAASLRRSDAMRPSTSSTMRSQRAARRGSWVTIRNAVPRSRLKRRISAKISSAEWVSRLPVGSSASTSGGDERQRAGDRHALLLAAGELARRVVEPVAEPDRRAAVPRALSRRAGVTGPSATRPGISTFSVAVNAGSRWWNWNTKPMRAPAQRGELRLGQLRGLAAEQPVRAARSAAPAARSG